jgi:hypothetical protein
VRTDELMLLYTVVHKIQVSPVKAMIRQWLMNIRMTSPIEFMSLITHIVSRLGVWRGRLCLSFQVTEASSTRHTFDSGTYT